MSSIFSKIINGEIPCYKIAEDENYFALLDINPLVIGHTLVVPKQETDYIFDLDNDLHKGLWNFAKHVGKALKQAVPCTRIGIAVIGLEVPHAHIHLIPINKMSDMNFANPKLKPSKEEMEETAALIREFLN